MYLKSPDVSLRFNHGRFQGTHHSPYSLAIFSNPSQIGFGGKSNMLPMIGRPLGPGGYGGCVGVHFFRARARIIAVTATAKVGPANFSRTDMTVVGWDGEKSECLGRTLKERPSQGNAACSYRVWNDKTGYQSLSAGHKSCHRSRSAGHKETRCVYNLQVRPAIDRHRLRGAVTSSGQNVFRVTGTGTSAARDQQTQTRQSPRSFFFASFLSCYNYPYTSNLRLVKEGVFLLEEWYE